MAERHFIAAIRNGLNFIAGISFQSSMTSTIPAFGPIAVRSMRTLREAASDLRETVPTAVPEVCDRLGRGQMQGQLKRHRF
jgi:hypothetical protein